MVLQLRGEIGDYVPEDNDGACSPDMAKEGGKHNQQDGANQENIAHFVVGPTEALELEREEWQFSNQQPATQ